MNTPDSPDSDNKVTFPMFAGRFSAWFTADGTLLDAEAISDRNRCTQVKRDGIMQTQTTVTITGNTFPVKEQIKSLGGRWNRIAQGWDVPEANAEAARALVAGAGESTYRPRADRYQSRSTYTRFSSGAEVFTNRRGRCEDAPCCGCCS